MNVSIFNTRYKCSIWETYTYVFLFLLTSNNLILCPKWCYDCFTFRIIDINVSIFDMIYKCSILSNVHIRVFIFSNIKSFASPPSMVPMLEPEQRALAASCGGPGPTTGLITPATGLVTGPPSRAGSSTVLNHVTSLNHVNHVTSKVTGGGAATPNTPRGSRARAKNPRVRWVATEYPFLSF